MQKKKLAGGGLEIMHNVFLIVGLTFAITSCGAPSSSVLKVAEQSSAAQDYQFECLLGSRSWFGSLRVEFRVSGQFDSKGTLGRVKFARTGSSNQRYDVVRQALRPQGNDADLFAFKAAREDGAAYYESTIFVKNKNFTGSTADFFSENPDTKAFFVSEYSWADLHGNTLSGTGVCYCPTCGVEPE